MFKATYKATLKNLLRAALIWVMFVLVLSVAVSKVGVPNYGKAIVENGRVVDNITDLDPEFEVDFHMYVQVLRNNFAQLSIYALPLLAIISVLLVLSRDYKDNFFEIEKAGGVKPSTYFIARLAAIITVNIVLGLVCHFFYNHLYCYTRDVIGDLGMTFGTYMSETTVRVLRLYFLGMFPGTLFYIGIAYAVGCLLKSGFLGTIAASSWVLFIFASQRNLELRMSKLYEFLDPHAHGFYQYWGYYDTEWFTDKALRNPWTAEELLLHTGLLVGIAALCFAVSYLCVRKRKV